MTQPYIIVSSTSRLNIRTISPRGAMGLSYSWRVYLRIRYQALRSVSWLRLLPRYTKPCICLFTCPTTSTLNVTAASSIRLVRLDFISVLAYETMRPKAAHTVTSWLIIFLGCSGNCWTIAALSAYIMLLSNNDRDGSPCPSRRRCRTGRARTRTLGAYDVTGMTKPCTRRRRAARMPCLHAIIEVTYNRNHSLRNTDVGGYSP